MVLLTFFVIFAFEYDKICLAGVSSMKFENLMYDGKNIKVVVDLDSVFIENNEIEIQSCDESDTLDLTDITNELTNGEEDYNVE